MYGFQTPPPPPPAPLCHSLTFAKTRTIYHQQHILLKKMKYVHAQPMKLYTLLAAHITRIAMKHIRNVHTISMIGIPGYSSMTAHS